MEVTAAARYLDFDERRKTQDALAADQADDAELKALQTKLTNRRSSEK